MKTEKELPAKIFELLGNKEYSELNANEKALVCEYLTADEYAAYAITIQAFKIADEGIKVDATLAGSKNKKPALWKGLLRYKIPFYHAAAACVVVGFFTFSVARNLYRNAPVLLDVVPTSARDTVGKPLDLETYPEQLIFNF